MSRWYPHAVGETLADLVQQQAKWSQATFGLDSERGPLGPLKHLEKEARECQAAPSDLTEYADCLLLLLDAARRAGFTEMQLIDEAVAKLQVNKTRKWPKPTSDDPVEHCR